MKVAPHSGSRRHISVTTAALCLFLSVSPGWAQQLNFINYSVEQGLSQSQAACIAQDPYGMIWVATLGGISRFDGNQFTTYDQRDGMRSQFIFKIFPQGDNRLWIGGHEGLELFDGRKFIAYDPPVATGNNSIVDILPHGSEEIYVLNGQGKLFLTKSDSLQESVPFKNHKLRDLASDRNGIPYAVSETEVYTLENAVPIVSTSDFGKEVQIKKIYFDSGNGLWLIANTGLYKRYETSFRQVISSDSINADLTCLVEDGKGRIWAGSTSGAYLIQPELPVRYIGAAAGLTDNTVNEIITDRENNLWFATDADGIYKLSSPELGRFDRSNGLPGNVIMAMSGHDGQIWVGSRDGGLARYSEGRFEEYPLSVNNLNLQKINALYHDSEGVLWIGTLGSGLWNFRNGQFSHIPVSGGAPVEEIISVTQTGSGVLWVTTPDGIYYLENGWMKKVNTIPGPCFSILEKLNETLWVGTSTGIWEISPQKKVTRITLGGIAPGTVNSMIYFGDLILLGTAENGILFYDPKKNESNLCTIDNGLSSNFIFSLYKEDANTILAGTGRGINKIRFNKERRTFQVRNLNPSVNLYGPECNLNAVLQTEDHKLWFGTTRGIFVYTPGDIPDPLAEPLIYLQSVSLFSRNITDESVQKKLNAWSVIPKNLVLPHKKNHLTFDFTAVYLSHPAGLKYQYQLVGADSAYSAPVPDSKIIYPNLRPGSYRFKAKAITDDQVVSRNEINFPFTIEKAYYQRGWFQILIAVLLILTGFLLQYLRIFYRGRQVMISRKIRLEEQRKIMERTSEDLHDDLGNKITRITVLTDVLQQKIDPADTEKSKLVHQIRENAQALYLGTKDIIWSLTPGNDNLFDTLENCRLLGVQLFEDTSIDFEVSVIPDALREVRVPLAISRNLNMVIKESFSNILKHSIAGSATMKVDYHLKGDLYIIVGDNGIGMHPTPENEGNGLTNMYKRMERIGGSLNIIQKATGGTELVFCIKIPLNGG